MSSKDEKISITSTSQYGSTDQAPGNETKKSSEHDYELGETFYLKKQQGFSATKCLRASVPIIIALLVIIGLVILMGQTYPKRNIHPVNGDDGTALVDVNGDSVAAVFCEANPRCVKVNITGRCCPTLSGVTLDCCD